MKNVQSVIKLKHKTWESCSDFERLMEKLFIYHGNQNGYLFEPAPRYGRTGIHGLVRENYPGIQCPAAFYFPGTKDSLDKGAVWQELQKSLETLLEPEKTIQSYVLVTPYDLEAEEKKRLDETRASLPAGITVHHLGPTAIQALLEVYPALKKYYYSLCECVDDPNQDFIAIDKKYKQRLRDSLKHLHFVGLPTGSYQKQHALVKPQLERVYIPMEFIEGEVDTAEINLSEILRKSNRVVILGNPGTGKSTLAHYLALKYSQPLGDGDIIKSGEKTPFIIPIRDLGQSSLEKSRSYDFIAYLQYSSKANYGFEIKDRDYFIAFLELGKSIVVFDGLDEVAFEESRIRIAKEIEIFSLRFPGSTIWVTSRIAGYAEPIALNPQHFDHYYLAPVSQQQARRFINKWYEIQVPVDNTIRKERIRSLQRAIDENPGVKQLRENPLLLTMMTLIHQFEGTLPDNRVRLYEKCIELLLKTWQDQKYSGLGIRNPLEERGLKYDIQLRLLAAAAYHIQKKVMNSNHEGSSLIEEKELEKVLFENRFDGKRMTEKKAREDIRVFLEYIRDRAGLLVEKGRNEKGENFFSFVHLSFLEYLTAYHIAENRSRSQEENIRELLKYLDKSGFSEPILLALHLFARSTGPAFIDVFTEEAIRKLSNEYNPEGWFLLGRAVRDNINFTPRDITTITSEIVNRWLDGKEGDNALSILKEIVYFSSDGKKILKAILKENIKKAPAEKAFRTLCFYKNFYKIDLSIPGLLSKNKDPDLLAYLPIFRSVKSLKEYIAENLDVRQWFIYFNSAPDKTLDNLDNLLSSQVNPVELMGYLLSSWRHILKRFHDYSRYPEQKNNECNDVKPAFTFQYNFSDYTRLHFPLMTFHPYVNFTIHLTETLILSDHWFILEDQKYPLLPGDKFIKAWVNKTAANILGEFEHHPSMKQPLPGDKKDHLLIMMSQFGENFTRDFLRNNHQHLIREFFQDLLKGSSRDFLLRFTHLLKQYLTGSGKSIQDVLWIFNRNLTKNITLETLRQFGRGFSQYIDTGFLRDFIPHFLRDRIHHLNQSFKTLISSLYHRHYNKALKWQYLSKSDYQRLDKLYMDEFTQGNSRFIDSFFIHLYEYLFYDKFEVSIEPCSDSTGSKSSFLSTDIGSWARLSMANSFMIPFTFCFRLTAALNHYLTHILSDWFMRFYDKEKIEPDMISAAVDAYCAKHPFMMYFIAYCWDFYAEDFNEMNRGAQENESDHLRLAVLIANAAKVSLATGMPLEGPAWEKIREQAEPIGSTNLLVNMSLTLYKLCTSKDKENNSALLKEILERLQKEYPRDYQLLGLMN